MVNFKKILLFNIFLLFNFCILFDTVANNQITKPVIEKKSKYSRIKEHLKKNKCKYALASVAIATTAFFYYKIVPVIKDTISSASETVTCSYCGNNHYKSCASVLNCCNQYIGDSCKVDYVRSLNFNQFKVIQQGFSFAFRSRAGVYWVGPQTKYDYPCPNSACTQRHDIYLMTN
ncbi:hypothetical protein M1446_03545 [Candidatus Dependentiae bacterium]|nr:hypothetical protein [Candidatus Dependentiae bacterium]